MIWPSVKVSSSLFQSTLAIADERCKAGVFRTPQWASFNPRSPLLTSDAPTRQEQALLFAFQSTLAIADERCPSWWWAASCPLKFQSTLAIADERCVALPSHQDMRESFQSTLAIADERCAAHTDATSSHP